MIATIDNFQTYINDANDSTKKISYQTALVPEDSTYGMKDLNFSSSILLEQFDCLQMTLNEEITLIGIGNAYI